MVQESPRRDGISSHVVPSTNTTDFLPKVNEYFLLKDINIKAAITYLGAHNETQESAKLKLLVSEGMAKVMQEQMRHQKTVRSIFEQLKNQPQDNEIYWVKFLNKCSEVGILKDDPRIESILKNLERMPKSINFL